MNFLLYSDVEWTLYLGAEVAGGAREAEPCLLVALHLDGQAKVRELHRRTLLFARQ